MSEATVLVVEDDPSLLSGIRDILRLADYQVITAQNAREALKILENIPDPPDIIVSDIMMPNMDGFEFLEQVRKIDQWVTIPFIFLTAKGEKHDRHRGSMMGADVYLTKPFDVDDLLVAVASRISRIRNIRRVQSREMNTLKRNILAIVNHEFRTPLTLIVAYSDMLQDFNPGNIDYEELADFLKGIGSGAGRLRRLVENFITLVEIDTRDARRLYNQRKIEIPDLEQLIYNACQSALQNSEHAHHFHIRHPLPVITGDAHYLTIAIRELIDNAHKFSQPDQVIEIGARSEENDCIIWVKDYGRGIPPHKLDEIWNPFFQYNRELYEDQGTGAGLAIVKGIAELHGGVVSVKSAPDKGSLFELRLPIPKSATRAHENTYQRS